MAARYKKILRSSGLRDLPGNKRTYVVNMPGNGNGKALKSKGKRPQRSASAASIQAKAHQCAISLLRATCFFKMVPYSWNSARRRLERASRLGWFAFHCTTCIPAWCTTFTTVRYLQTMHEQAPPRIRVMNFNWTLGYLLVFVCKMQVTIRTDQIMTFANAMLEHNERMLAKARWRETMRAAIGKAESAVSGGAMDAVSAIVFLSTYLWVTNPPSHAIVILDMPCAPQYISSIILPCRFIGDRPVPYAQLLPFMAWEYFTILDMMTIAAFLWIIILLGLTWIKETLQLHRHKDATGRERDSVALAIMNLDYMKSVLEFRLAQLLTRLINNSFRLYLTYFPSMLFFTSGALIFSTIRFTHLPLHLYLVFPFCAFRCLLEVLSLLNAAGNVNLASELYLDQYDVQIGALSHVKCYGTGRKAEALTFVAYLKKFRRSCKRLTCSSGSLYTLEKTIMLVSMHGCIELVFNMLLMFPNVDEGSWGTGKAS